LLKAEKKQLPMYRKPRFLEKLHAIREQLAEVCGYEAEQLAARLQGEDAAMPAPSSTTEPTSEALPVWIQSSSSQ
jgi:hypothetical protein